MLWRCIELTSLILYVWKVAPDIIKSGCQNHLMIVLGGNILHLIVVDNFIGCIELVFW